MHTKLRLAALERGLKVPGLVTVESIKAILSSHDDPLNPVCRHRPAKGAGSSTFGCAVMELSTPPRLQLAPGPPCSTEFEIFTF